MKYRIRAFKDKVMYIDTVMHFDDEHEVYQTGEKFFSGSLKSTNLHIDLMAKDISEIGYSSFHWDEVSGKSVFSRLSNCD